MYMYVNIHMSLKKSLHACVLHVYTYCHIYIYIYTHSYVCTIRLGLVFEFVILIYAGTPATIFRRAAALLWLKAWGS